MIFYLIGLLSYYKLAKKPVPFGICLSFFLVIIIPLLTTLFFLLSRHWIFQALVFIAGLFCWTFIEYCVNRFWGFKNPCFKYKNPNRFLQHYRLWQNIYSIVKLLSLLTITLLLVIVSLGVSRYLLLPAGFFTGFTIYYFIYKTLHKKGPADQFSKHLKLHRQLYFDLSENCYGITVTWWDYLFGTMPKKKKNILFRNPVLE